MWSDRRTSLSNVYFARTLSYLQLEMSSSPLMIICRPSSFLPSFFLSLQQHSAPTNKVICACTTTDDSAADAGDSIHWQWP